MQIDNHPKGWARLTLDAGDFSVEGRENLVYTLRNADPVREIWLPSAMKLDRASFIQTTLYKETVKFYAMGVEIHEGYAD